MKTPAWFWRLCSFFSRSAGSGGISLDIFQKLMTIEERKEYGESIYDDLRTLIALRHIQRDIAGPEIMDETYCVTCDGFFKGPPIVHATWHLMGGSTSTPPPEFS